MVENCWKLVAMPTAVVEIFRRRCWECVPISASEYQRPIMLPSLDMAFSVSMPAMDSTSMVCCRPWSACASRAASVTRRCRISPATAMAPMAANGISASQPAM